MVVELEEGRLGLCRHQNRNPRVVSLNMKRSGNRDLDEFRELTVSFDGLERVDGSARFGFGDTKALASVSGPIEVRLATEQVSRSTFEVLVRPLAGLPGTEAKSLSSTIRAILTPSLVLSQNPRTLIQLVVQSITPIASRRLPPTLVASLVNASTLALLNTGSVPMRGVVCAVAIGRLRTPGGPSYETHPRTILTMDPDDEELSSLEGGGCFAFFFSASATRVGGKSGSQSMVPCEMVWSNWQSPTSFSDGEFVRAKDQARIGAEKVWLEMKEAVDRKRLLSSRQSDYT